MYINDDLTPLRAKMAHILRYDPSPQSKRKLRDTNRKGVYINDDLTPLRAKMGHILLNDPSTQSVWSIDGRIFCTMLENGSEMKKIVDSPDDLFRFGWREEKVKKLNLCY